MKPRRRRGPTAGGAGATRAAPTRLNWSSLQRVDEVGVHRVRGLHRAVDLALGLPEITGGLDVVVDLSRITLGAHDLLALLQIEQGERIEIGLHIVRGLAGGLAYDAQSLCGVLLEPVEGVVVGLHELLDGRRIFVDEVFPEREAVHDQVRIFLRRNENESIATRLGLAQPRLPRHRDIDLPGDERGTGFAGLHVLLFHVCQRQAVLLEYLRQEPLRNRALVDGDLLALEVLDRLDRVLREYAVTTDRRVNGENFDRGYSVGLSPGEGIDGRCHAFQPTRG